MRTVTVLAYARQPLELSASGCPQAPGPMGDPGGTPGVTYCWPWPSCCPPAPDRWAWLHDALADIGSNDALHAALGLLAVAALAAFPILRRELRRLRG